TWMAHTAISWVVSLRNCGISGKLIRPAVLLAGMINSTSSNRVIPFRILYNFVCLKWERRGSAPDPFRYAYTRWFLRDDRRILCQYAFVQQVDAGICIQRGHCRGKD